MMACRIDRKRATSLRRAPSPNSALVLVRQDAHSAQKEVRSSDQMLFLLRLGRCALKFSRLRLRAGSISVVRIDLRVVLTTRNRHVRKTVVNQQFALVCVHANQNSVRGLSLAAVAGDGVSAVKMRMLGRIEVDSSAVFQPNGDVAIRANVFDHA
jgi:hypothetical protein